MRLSGRKSMTFRLTMLFALSSTVVLLFLGYLIAGSLERHFEEQDMEVLTGKLKLVQHALEKVRSTGDLNVLPQQLDDSLVGHHGLELVVVAPQGQILFATSGAQFPPSLLDNQVRVDSARPTVWTTKEDVYKRHTTECPATTGSACYRRGSERASGSGRRTW